MLRANIIVHTERMFQWPRKEEDSGQIGGKAILLGMEESVLQRPEWEREIRVLSGREFL